MEFPMVRSRSAVAEVEVDVEVWGETSEQKAHSD